MAVPDPQLYVHVRVVMGMILGLCITRLLAGFAKFIQHPHEHQASRLHLGWAGTMLISAILFWWWEFRLSHVQWTFFIYLFILSYASMFYFMCVLLFPDHLGEYANYDDYFFAKRRWFFGLLALSHVMDVGDTWVKGAEYVQMVGLAEFSASAVLFAGALIAMRTRSRAYHGGYLIVTLSTQLFWIGWLLNTLT